MKRHVLFILENNIFPIDTRVRREAKMAKKIGFHVSTISPKNRHRKRFEIIDGIDVYRHKRLSAKGPKYGFVIEYLNAFMFEFILSLRVFLKRPFHVIHAANPPDYIFLIALFYKIIGVKFIFDHHDLAPELYLTKL